MMLTKLSKTILALSLAFVMSTQAMSSSKRREEGREEAVEEYESTKRRRGVPVHTSNRAVGAGARTDGDSRDIVYKYEFMSPKHLKALRALNTMKDITDHRVRSQATSSSSSSSSSLSSHRVESKEEKRDEEEIDVKNKHVVSLDLSDDRDLTDISFIRFFPALTELNLANCYNLGDSYQPISQLTTLEKLNIFDTGLTKPRYIKTLTNLTSLNISCPDIAKAMKYIVRFQKLRELYIGGGGIMGLERISQLTTLENLNLSGVFNNTSEEDGFYFPSLDFISPLTNLRRLDVSTNDNIFSIKPLVRLPRLTYLNLSGCPYIGDLRKLRKLISLIHLDLRYLNSTCIPTLEKDLITLKSLSTLSILIVSSGI